MAIMLEKEFHFLTNPAEPVNVVTYGQLHDEWGHDPDTARRTLFAPSGRLGPG